MVDVTFNQLDISVTFLMIGALVALPVVPSLTFFIIAAVAIHVLQASGYFYFKKNYYLNDFLFRQSILIIKVIYLCVVIFSSTIS